jgi:MFS transporter, FSR family, fosmidomycin resistance protein
MLRQIVQLISLALGHGCVDGCATMVYPLIRGRIITFGMSPAAIAVMTTIVMNVTCSFTQPFFALWSDRWGGRWAALIAPFIAGVGIAAAIEARTPSSMVLFLAICGLAVAVYHPIPASIVGDLWPKRRALSLGVFLAGGTLGLGLGPIVVAGILNSRDPGNAWWLLIGSAPITLLLLASCGPARSVAGQAPTIGPLREVFRGRLGVMTLLVVISTLRALTTTGVNLGVTLLTEQQKAPLSWTGLALAVFLFCSGLTGLLSGLLHPRHERSLLVATSVVSLVAVAGIPWGGPWRMIACLAVAGAALQGVNPIIVSMSQRAMPSGSRMASSLVMGWSWGIGGLSGMVVTFIHPAEWAFAAIALAMIPAGVLAALLPAVSVGGPGSLASRPQNAASGHLVRDDTA